MEEEAEAVVANGLTREESPATDEKFAIITLQTMRFAIIGLLTWTLL
jgi:hypothetical protein